MCALSGETAGREEKGTGNDCQASRSVGRERGGGGSKSRGLCGAGRQSAKMWIRSLAVAGLIHHRGWNHSVPLRRCTRGHLPWASAPRTLEWRAKPSPYPPNLPAPPCALAPCTAYLSFCGCTYLQPSHRHALQYSRHNLGTLVISNLLRFAPCSDCPAEHRCARWLHLFRTSAPCDDDRRSQFCDYQQLQVSRSYRVATLWPGSAPLWGRHPGRADECMNERTSQ